MSNYISEFNFELTSPIQYGAGGDMAEGTSLTVYAPNNPVSKYCAFIEAQYNKAVIDFQIKFAHLATEDTRKQAEEKATELSEQDQQDTILMMLFSSSDMDKCMVAFQELLTYSFGKYASCRVDGIQQLTRPLYDQLSYRDTKQLMGKYIVNFINSSR